MKKETYYFSHDLNARNDPKILILRSVYGLEGYRRYWVLIGRLRMFGVISERSGLDAV